MSWFNKLFSVFSFSPFSSSTNKNKHRYQSSYPLYFGEVIGEIQVKINNLNTVYVTAYSNDDIYSSNYDPSNFYLYSSEYKNPIFTGRKWECVEFVRRFLILTRDVTFHEIDHAYEIWNLPYFLKLPQGVQPIEKIRKRRSVRDFEIPQKGDVMVWSKSKHFPFGHVAIAVGISLEKGNIQVAIAEQNWDDKKWKHRHYSRIIDLSNEPFLIGWIRVL